MLKIVLIFLAPFLIAHGLKEVQFVELPSDTNVKLNEAVLFPCKLSMAVEECQWSWRPLHNMDDTELIVKQFPAFGEQRRDCSVRFNNMLNEQQGIWTCSIRIMDQENFTMSASAKLTIYEPHKLTFVEEPQDVDAMLGELVRIACKTSEPVEECQWTWAPADSKESPVVKTTFAARGDSAQDCSLKLEVLAAEQEGIWICGAHIKNETNYTTSTPAKLTIVPREVTFVEFSHDTEVPLGKTVQLACKTSEEVEECRWLWKPLTHDMHDNVVIKQFQTSENRSNDCSIHFDSIEDEQEGFWTCGARYLGETAFTNAHPVRLSIYSGLKFVQLSQDIQAAVGEPVLLRCVTNLALYQCQWSWKPHNSSDQQALVVKQFPAYGDESRDCSVRFKSVLEEQEGVWTCGVRLYPNTDFITASSLASVTLLPAVKLKFLEQPEDMRVALGEPAVLRCVATTAVDNCVWNWHSLAHPNETGLLVEQFLPNGKHNRDCSLHFDKILAEQEGLWDCEVKGPPNSTVQRTQLAKVLVYEPVPIHFVELSQDIQMPPGGPLLLRCVTASPVEQCIWSWQSMNSVNKTPVVFKEFSALGNDNRDCSVRFNSIMEEHEGVWTCGVRNQGETHYTNASPAKITLLQPVSLENLDGKYFYATSRQSDITPHQLGKGSDVNSTESVMVGLWSAPEQKVTLACRLSAPQPNATCHWHHPPSIAITAANQTHRFAVEHNTSSAMCTIMFSPEQQDLGQWSCIFTVTTPSGDWEMASATLVLLSTPSDEKLSWLVGVLAAMVLSLTVMLVIVAVCKCKRKSHQGLENSSIQNKHDKKLPDRYSESPTKINFQFGETPGRGTTLAEPTNQHIYERVDRGINCIRNESRPITDKEKAEKVNSKTIK